MALFAKEESFFLPEKNDKLVVSLSSTLYNVVSCIMGIDYDLLILFDHISIQVVRRSGKTIC